MIFITAKFRVRPEYAETWPEIAGPFTRATRNEPGCLWFDWARSIEDPTEYVLVEAFRDHFKTAQQILPQRLVATSRIVNTTIPQDDWAELGELAVPE